MEFCSSHVFVYSNSEDESISGDEEESKIVYEEEGPSLKGDDTFALNEEEKQKLIVFNYSSSSSEALNNSSSRKRVYNSSFIAQKNQTQLSSVVDQQYRFRVPNSMPLSTINGQNISSNALFYYNSSDSSLKSVENESDESALVYEDTSSSLLLSASHNPLAKLYNQTTLNHFNSVSSDALSTSRASSTKVRKPDTNIISIRLNELVQNSGGDGSHTGDPVYCETCNAILSSQSVLADLKHKGAIRGKLWDCEYCSTKNMLEIEQAEIPTRQDVTFLIEPPKELGYDDESIIVFCIDTSGSMNVTEKVNGQLQLKNAMNKMRRFEMETGERLEASENETFVSRLDSLQLAIEQNLEQLRLKFPNKKAFIIAFNDNVTILGDGTSDPICVSSDKFDDEDRLLEYCNDVKFIKPLRETKEKLLKQLYSLEANGSTALGPALLLAINIASKKKGSQVILCTDGLANNGFGSLEERVNDEAIMFYDNLTNLAIKTGVSVSIVTLKGTGCKLSVIGRLANYTNGHITCVDQARIKDEIESIIESSKIIATNVVATVIAHKSIYILNDNNPGLKHNKLVRAIGAVTSDYEISFQYGVKCTDDELTQLNKLDSLPFQLQLTYEGKDGSKIMRVITERKPHTKERKVAEKNCSLKLVAKHALNSQASEVTHKLFSQTKFSSLPIKSKIKSVKKYLSERKYKNDLINESFSVLLKATESKSLQHQTGDNSDEESENIIRLAAHRI